MEIHHFERGDLLVGSKYAKVAQIHLQINFGNPINYNPNPYLNGRIQAEGTFWELAKREHPLLANTQQAILKLTNENRCTAIKILRQGSVQRIEPYTNPYERLYEWKFLVIGEASDCIRLFACPKQPIIAEELEISDLLSLLGATMEELTDAKAKLRTTTEGGWINNS